jgi:hypothetical protein
MSTTDSSKRDRPPSDDDIVYDEPPPTQRRRLFERELKPEVQQLVLTKWNLLEWGRNYRIFDQRMECMEQTHTLITGGVIHCEPDFRSSGFYHALIEDYRGSTPSCIPHAISEIISPAHNETDEHWRNRNVMLFFEFDVPDGEAWAATEHAAVIKCIDDVLQRMWPNNTPYHIYLSTKSDLEPTSGPALVLQGVHIHTSICTRIWTLPWIYAFVLQHLNQELPRRPGQQPWTEVLDLQVIQGKKINLRMNGAIKAVECCSTRRKAAWKQGQPFTCPVRYCCRGKRLIFQTYRITSVYKRGAIVDDEEDDNATMTLMSELITTTIRPQPGTSLTQGFTIPNDAPEPDTIIPSSKSSDKGMGCLTRMKLNPSSSQHHLIRELLHSIRPEWRSLDVKEVMRGKSKAGDPVYHVNVTGTGANYCMNRQGGFHTGQNRIRFSIYKKGVYQSCNAGKKTEKRLNGACCDFSSRCLPFDARFNSLF